MAQAVEAAQLAEDLKVQLEHTQTKLREIQASVLDNRTARERRVPTSREHRYMGTCFVDMFGKQMSGNSVCNSSTMLFFFFRRTCPGCGVSWRNRRKLRCTQMLMRFCKKKLISIRWGLAFQRLFLCRQPVKHKLVPSVVSWILLYSARMH